MPLSVSDETLIVVQAGLEFALSMFYDGTTPAPGVFDDFLALPSTLNDVSARNMTSLVQTTNAFKPSSRYVSSFLIVSVAY